MCVALACLLEGLAFVNNKECLESEWIWKPKKKLYKIIRR